MTQHPSMACDIDAIMNSAFNHNNDDANNVVVMGTQCIEWQRQHPDGKHKETMRQLINTKAMITARQASRLVLLAIPVSIGLEQELFVDPRILELVFGHLVILSMRIALLSI